MAGLTHKLLRTVILPLVFASIFVVVLNTGCSPATGYFFYQSISAPAQTQQPSHGCQRSAPGRMPNTINVAGETREYILAVPKNYQPNHAYSLVFAFHGRTSSNEKVRSYYDLEENALHPTIFVYPSGKRLSNSRYNWAEPGDPATRLRDFELFDKLLKNIADNYCVALDRVYVAAHSLGASFTNNLGCARGTQIRAVATLGGGISSAKNCNGEVAAMILHNPKDRLVPFASGVRARDHFLQQNNLTDKTAVPVYGSELNCERYGEAEVLNPVVWCPHTVDHNSRGKFYPHTWPDQTGYAIMRFFATLP